MKRILALLCGCLFIFNALSEQRAAINAPLANQSLLLDITKISENRIVAIGERGHILLSENGVNWQQANVPVRTTLTAIYFANEKQGWAVGHDSVILFSDDAGDNWQVQQFLPKKEKPLLDIIFFNLLEGIAIGAYGQQYRTLDGGENWNFEFHEEFLFSEDIDYLQELKQEDEAAYLDEQGSILPHFNRLYNDGNTLYMVGEVGLLAKSNDLGKTWQPFDEIYSGSFNDIIKTEQDSLLAVGLRGNIFRSINGGISWQHSNTPNQALLNSIVLADNNIIYVLGNNGTLLTSTDDGVSFSLTVQKDGKSLVSGIFFQEELLVVSDVGIKHIKPSQSSAHSTK
jgi:photosystem II stability/assembly factor-like uncharacterized protein